MAKHTGESHRWPGFVICSAHETTHSSFPKIQQSQAPISQSLWTGWCELILPQQIPPLSPNPNCSPQAFPPSACSLTKSKPISSRTWQSHKTKGLLVQLTELGEARIKVSLDPRERAGGLRNWGWQRTGLWAAVIITSPVPGSSGGYIIKKFRLPRNFICLISTLHELGLLTLRLAYVYI